MYNGIRVVKSIAIRNNSSSALEGAVLRLFSTPHFARHAEIPVGRIAPKGRAVVDGKDAVLSHEFIAKINEPCIGHLTVKLLLGDTVLSEDNKEIGILPYGNWAGLAKTPEMLASYVVPNHPEVRKIIETVTSQLQCGTGETFMDAYSSGSPQSVISQMEAVYNAIAQSGIHFVNSAMTFSGSGQRIRLPEEILPNGIASSLDLAVLYAGCLEDIGIRPVVVFKSGHVLAGAWTEKVSSPYAVDDDASVLRKHSAKGICEMALVDTVGMTEEMYMPFAEACSSADKMITESDDFLCFIDIHAARKMGVIPLPQRIQTNDGYVLRAENADKSSVVSSRYADLDVIDLDVPQEVDKHTIWERRLLDLTLRNELLNIHTGSGCIQLVTPGCETLSERITTGRGFKIGTITGIDWQRIRIKKGIYAAISKADSIWGYTEGNLYDGWIHSFLENSEVDERISTIRRTARLSLEENGANTLFLTVGALRWFNEEGKGPYLAPIILYPVEFGGFSNNSLSITDEDPVINMTLLEMLRQKFGVTIPGLDPLPTKTGGRVDVRLVLNTIRRAVMDRKGWDVDDIAFLGNFLFGKFIIWNDIHAHRKMLDANPVVSSLVNGKLEVKDIGALPEGCDLDSECPSSEVLLPLKADSSQLRAIAEAIRGRSFVMHGPPGTGKSQTITNIIANALYHSKRVLFVSEKKAALEVVQSRLSALGLDPFCLELHSNKIRKSVVMRKMEATLAIEGPHSTGDFAEDARQADALRAKLNAHIKGLHRKYPAGLSLYDCLSRYLSLGEGPEWEFHPTVMRDLTPRDMRMMVATLDEYLTAIEHSGIGPSCGLLDMPVSSWTPEYAVRLKGSLKKVSRASGIRLLLAERKLVRVLNAHIDIGFTSAKIAETKRKAIRWLASIDEGREYALYASVRGHLSRYALRKAKLRQVSDAYECGKVDASGLKDFYLRTLYRSYAEYIFSAEAELNLFCGDLFESYIERFRSIECDLRNSSRKAIYAAAASRLPQPGSDGVDGSEMTILLKAIRNGCRGMSLRTLFSKIPTVLPRLCPCMLMSPLSVSQYLEAKEGMFDLVIFDEASQLPTCEAVAAIARAKAVVVVGDPNQLPPTSFFETTSFDEGNADIEDLDSILDECLAMPLPSNHLRWHYRSRHESLIAFSNANYYENRLLTFPSNDDMCSKVTFHKVDGLYERGGSRQNALEADAVVADVKRRLSDPDTEGQSIGIVTFSVAQRNVIEKKLEEMLRQCPAVRKALSELQEPIFVKSLESVQGDERDVILFSVGYGVDSKGRLPMNFGPLNQAGGWRRLNVAVTRSRVEMKVFSSILPEQIPANGLSRGVLDLRAFLSYAISRDEALEMTASKGNEKDAFVEALAEEMRRSGKVVRTHIGSSDFKVDIGVVDPLNPECYSIGILVDGPTQASAESAMDREVIRPELLERLGWRIERKWILDFYDKWVHNSNYDDRD